MCVCRRYAPVKVFLWSLLLWSPSHFGESEGDRIGVRSHTSVRPDPVEYRNRPMPPFDPRFSSFEMCVNPYQIKDFRVGARIVQSPAIASIAGSNCVLCGYSCYKEFLDVSSWFRRTVWVFLMCHCHEKRTQGSADSSSLATRSPPGFHVIVVLITKRCMPVAWHCISFPLLGRWSPVFYHHGVQRAGSAIGTWVRAVEVPFNVESVILSFSPSEIGLHCSRSSQFIIHEGSRDDS